MVVHGERRVEIRQIPNPGDEVWFELPESAVGVDAATSKLL